MNNPKPKKTKMPNEWLVYDNDRFILYKGYPLRKDSTRVDVTMAVKIGMRIAKKDYNGIESKHLSLNS